MRLTYVYFRVLCHIFANKYILERYFLQAVLETIRDLMNTECIVPDWLHDIFLGYDDPGAAHYSRYINITWSHFTACVPLFGLSVWFLRAVAITLQCLIERRKTILSQVIAANHKRGRKFNEPMETQPHHWESAGKNAYDWVTMRVVFQLVQKMTRTLRQRKRKADKFFK